MAILLLRPLPTLDRSCENFKEAGLDVVGLALVDIEYIDGEIADLREALERCSDTTLIVTSQFAARSIRPLEVPVSSCKRVIAVGPTTANSLPDACNAVVPENHSSEGIIEKLRHLDLSQSNILVKGKDGRSALESWFRDQQIPLTVSNVYQRKKLQPPVTNRQWKAEEIQCIIATSGEQLQLTYNEYNADWLNSLPWIVVSDRIASMAREKGIQKVVVSTDATDHSLIQAATNILEQ